MRVLPRQFHPRHRRAGLAVRAGAASIAALSVTMLTAGSGASTLDSRFVALPAYAAYEAPPAAVPTIPPTVPPAVPPTVPPATPPASVPPAAAPAKPQPVAGLDQRQMDNAATIVRQGRAQGMPQRALVVAVATAMQESDLYNVASKAVPSSLQLPHEGLSTDHDSVGLFQQRASQGWGTVPQLMDPAHSAMLFYSALAQVRGWERMSVTAAAQAVQKSAFPSAYQKHAAKAEQIVAALS
ncbi:hypothetical protein KZZ52_52630 [Dactylosporangium sp. AC04546]|uniref:hypothetical protein n=1 Tax=Dactylosporangium sp. AC04546 TaxID=2862460 RepID=UPI001EDEF0D7|nr:hypothetical protein [Dactylosporangium sp. AC04546]WVK82504.1 hypothetical protein KZZ52_52630 [Dactylosporangium sp. AC04546]